MCLPCIMLSVQVEQAADVIQKLYITAQELPTGDKYVTHQDFLLKIGCDDRK